MTGTIALIVAAGDSRRMGGETPKPYRFLGGKSLIAWSVEAFSSHPAIRGVVVVTNPAHKEYGKLLGGLSILYTTKGGISRKQSVEFGLKSLALLEDPPEKVLIHDAARPFVSARVIDNVLQGLDASRGAVPATVVSDTLKQAEEGRITETVSRENLYSVQTPQGFYLEDIVKAHEACRDLSMTDDAAVAEQAGITVAIAEGEARNIKLTHPQDWELAEKLLGGITVTGTGFDVHRLLKGDEKPLMLGGVQVPCELYLDGHSDADVILHALVDAILGTISEGDIGTHFPPSDAKWKNVSSQVFIYHALKLLHEKGRRLIHADVTVIGDKPKIGPHRDAIRKQLSALLGLPLEHVSLKATTTEGLGFLGKGDGVAAQAVVSVRHG